MRFDFKELPGESEVFLRPVALVRLAGQRTVLHPCLLDTGSLHNRFALWTAPAAGIDLAGGEEARLALGGLVTSAVTVRVDLAIDDLRWAAPVSFCDPWPFGFQLLGQEGFFRFFRASFRAGTYSFELHQDLGDV